MKRRIRVGIDMRSMKVAKTGVKTFQEELCKAFGKQQDGFIFYYINTYLPVYTGNNKLLKIIEHCRFFGWKQFTLPLACFFRRCNVLLCVDYFLPLFKLRFKTAVVFHDAFFWEYPAHYNSLWLKLLNTIGMRAARKADAIITVTAYSKKQLLHYTKLRPEQIFVIHLAPKSISPAVSGSTNTIRKKMILHVGVLEKRKNLPNLIRAFDLLLKNGGWDDYHLLLAGNKINKTGLDDSEAILSLIQTLQLEEKVHLPGFVPDDQLSTLYNTAMVYAFVSTNEGFGLPVLEAFQHRLPVLVADNSCLPEVGGDAVVSCNPFDPADIKEKLKFILENASLQEEMARKGQERLHQFSWQKTANGFLTVFRNITQ